MAIVPLEDKPPSKIQTSFPQVFLYILLHPLPFNSDQFPSPSGGKTSPQHDAAPTMFHCGDGDLSMMRGIRVASDKALMSLMTEKFHLSLTTAPSSTRVRLLQYVFIFCPLFHEAQICAVHGL